MLFTTLFVHQFIIIYYYLQPLLTFFYLFIYFARHRYNTRLASSSRIVSPFARKIYGKFNQQFLGAQILNVIDESTKLPHNSFERLHSELFISIINSLF